MRKGVFLFVLISAMLVLACGVALAAGSRVQIATLHCDGPGDDNQHPNGEYVTFKNTSGQVARMGGFRVHDKGATHVYRFPSGYKLGARKSVTLYTGKGRNGGGRLYWGLGSAVWNNTGDTATLVDRSGRVLDQHGCSDV